MKQKKSTHFLTSILIALCLAGTVRGTAPVGLENRSSICYLNAVVQCLMRSASAQRLMQQPTNPFKQNTPAHAFYEFIHAPTKPDTLKSSHAVADRVKDELARHQDPRGQQDACDAFRILVTSIQEDIDHTLVKTSGQQQFNSFAFHQAAQIAGTRHTLPDRASYIGPIIPQNDKTLTQLLQAYFAPQQTDTVIKQDYLRSTPTTLCIYVQRLTRTLDNPIDVLDTTRIAFPAYLDLLAISFPIPPETERSLYQLIGYVEFSGGTNGGHYVAHVKYDETWYLCNDESISKEQPNFSNPGATLLFYELIPQNQPTLQKTKVRATPPMITSQHAEVPSRAYPWWARIKRAIKQPRTWLGLGCLTLLALIIGDYTGTF